jgi:hypothetical protein
MIPIEAVYGLLLALFALIGLSRRFPVELGATIGFAAMLFVLLMADELLAEVAERALGAAGLSADPALVAWFALSTVIAMWVGFMYVGQTLTFAGTWPPNPVVGAFLDMLVGTLNGWLVVGTWWFYSDALGYPMRSLGWFVPPLSARAQALVALTPPAILPEGYGVWMVGAFLVFLIALRVFR